MAHHRELFLLFYILSVSGTFGKYDVVSVLFSFLNIFIEYIILYTHDVDFSHFISLWPKT